MGLKSSVLAIYIEVAERKNAKTEFRYIKWFRNKSWIRHPKNQSRFPFDNFLKNYHRLDIQCQLVMSNFKAFNCRQCLTDCFQMILLKSSTEYIPTYYYLLIMLRVFSCRFSNRYMTDISLSFSLSISFFRSDVEQNIFSYMI